MAFKAKGSHHRLGGRSLKLLCCYFTRFRRNFFSTMLFACRECEAIESNVAFELPVTLAEPALLPLRVVATVTVAVAARPIPVTDRVRTLPTVLTTLTTPALTDAAKL